MSAEMRSIVIPLSPFQVGARDLYHNLTHSNSNSSILSHRQNVPFFNINFIFKSSTMDCGIYSMTTACFCVQTITIGLKHASHKPSLAQRQYEE